MLEIRKNLRNLRLLLVINLEFKLNLILNNQQIRKRYIAIH